MKKRMGKAAALGLAVLLFLSGCAENNKKENVKKPEPVPEKETAAEVVKEEPKKERLPFRVTLRPQKKVYGAGEETLGTILTYEDVSVEGDGFEKVKKAPESWSLERSEELRSRAAELTEDHVWQNLIPMRADERIVSILEQSSYRKVIDSVYRVLNTAVNFDAQTGKQLTLPEIIRDWDSFSEIAGQHLTDVLQSGVGEGAALDAGSAVQELKDGRMDWYADASGIVILLRDEFVSPENAGQGQLRLAYQEFGQYIKKEYLPAGGRAIALLPVNQEVSAVVPESGEEAFLMLKSDESGLVLWSGEAKKALTERTESLRDAYLLNSGENLYAVVSFERAEDDCETYVCLVDSGKLAKVNDLDGSVDVNTLTADGFVLETPIHMLGTYQGRKTYHIGEDRKFLTEDAEYEISDNETVLTTKQELPVRLEGAENVLPAGSNIVLTATDEQTYVKFRVQETGQEGILAIERGTDDKPNVTVCGRKETECFETLR